VWSVWSVDQSGQCDQCGQSGQLISWSLCSVWSRSTSHMYLLLAACR